MKNSSLSDAQIVAINMHIRTGRKIIERFPHVAQLYHRQNLTEIVESEGLDVKLGRTLEQARR